MEEIRAAAIIKQFIPCFKQIAQWNFTNFYLPFVLLQIFMFPATRFDIGKSEVELN